MYPQTCQSLSSLDDIMFTTMGKIFSHCYVLTGMFPIFIARASLQSVLLTSSVDDSLLISSFLMLILMKKFMTMLGLFLRFVSGSSYAGANIKVDFNSQQAGFIKRPLANTCSSHLHLSTSYMILKEFKTEFINVLNHSDAVISSPTLHYKHVIVITDIFFST